MFHSASDKTSASRTEFYSDGCAYVLQIKGDFLHLKCVKAWELHPLSSFDKDIELISVISTSFETDCCRVDNNGEPLLKESFYNWMNNKSSCHCLVINLNVKQNKYHRKLQTIKLRTLEMESCVHWHELINLELEKSLKRQVYVRPRKLLVFVNPSSGEKKGKFVYDTIISPLFKLAEIESTVVFTQYQNHAKEYIESADLSTYDGVIAVGGDGTIVEVLNGILVAEQKRRGISLSGEGVLLNKPVKYSKPAIRLGFVPIGSGNVLSFTTHGPCDPETSTLQIICGESHPLDVSSMHDDKGNLLMFCHGGVTYGFMSEVMRLSDRIRFLLGPIRFTLTQIKAFYDFKVYPAEITYLPDFADDTEKETPESFSKCRYPCPVCLSPSVFKARSNRTLASSSSTTELSAPPTTSDLQAMQEPSTDEINGLSDKLQKSANVKHVTKLEPEPKDADLCKGDDYAGPGESSQAHSSAGIPEDHPEDSQDKWKVIRGNFLAVSSLNNSATSSVAPEGFHPSGHLADGKLRLQMTHATTRRVSIDLVKHYKAGKDTSHFSCSEGHFTKGFHVRKSVTEGQEPNGDFSPAPNQGIFMCDGEVIDKESLTVWIHKGLIDIFARGIEKE